MKGGNSDEIIAIENHSMMAVTVLWNLIAALGLTCTFVVNRMILEQ